jgi:hypothetical protein
MKFLIKLLKKIDNKIFFGLNFFYPRFLEKEVMGSDCQTLLDLGCGEESPIKFFSKKLKYSLGVDNFIPYIEQSKQSKIHSDYIAADLFEICGKLKDNSFDCVLASDLIEHLNKADGLRLISEMERIALKKVLIFTPNGFLRQEEYDNNKGQIHLSGWRPNEMNKLNYRVYGIGGLKLIKGEKRKINLYPKFFWARIALISQFFLLKFPHLSFQMLCVKDKNYGKN